MLTSHSPCCCTMFPAAGKHCGLHKGKSHKLLGTKVKGKSYTNMLRTVSLRLKDWVTRTRHAYLQCTWGSGALSDGQPGLKQYHGGSTKAGLQALFPSVIRGSPSQPQLACAGEDMPSWSIAMAGVLAMPKVLSAACIPVHRRYWARDASVVQHRIWWQ